MPVRHDFSFSRVVIIVLAMLLPVLPVAAHNGADAIFSAPQAVTPGTPTVAVSGTVSDLIVDNRVTNTSTRYILLRLDEGRTLALRGSGIDGLGNGARVAATGQPVGNTFFVTSVSVVPGASVPSAAGATPATATGTLTVFHADYFAEGRGEYGLVIQGNDGRPTQLNMPVIPDTLRAGMTVTANGTVAANGFALDVITITVMADPSADFNRIAESATTNNVLVIPIKFTDSPAEPWPASTINTEFQTRVAPFYQEQSFGQQLLNVTVACTTTAPSGCAAHTSAGGWLLASAATPANCNYTSIASLADSAATAAGYTLSNYKNRFYIFYNAGCGWAGLAYIGSPYQAWGNGYYQLWVSGHELGHNFTLWHAGSLYCPGTSIGPGCTGAYTANEYGDPWDVMGNVYPGHFNAMQKSALNWLPSGSVKTHSSGTASYTLSPIENPGQSTYAVTIPAATNRTYWIEYRQPIGFDNGMTSSNGAQIRVAAPFEFPCTGCGGDDTQVLDMTLGTPGTFSDAALLQGQSYTDSQYGVTVSVTNVVPGPSGSVTLAVSMSGKGPTTTTLASSANPSALGASVTLTVTVTGTAPTGTITFTDTGGVAVSGCGPVALPAGTPNTKTAACTTTSLGFGTHSIVASYSGDAANTSSSSSPLAQVVTMGLTTSTTSVASSANPSMAGASVTFTSTVTGAAPTGTVAFTDNGTTISGCSAVALPTGAPSTKTATCSTNSLIAGTHGIVATYSGDSANTSSTSSTFSEAVKAASTTGIASSANPSMIGTSVTFTASVTGSAPTGTAAFTDNGTTISGCGAVALPTGTSSTKTTSCSTSALTAGTHSIVATYSGDSSNAASTSTSLSQVVKVSNNPMLGDLDGDGTSDLIWQSSSTSQGAFWFMLNGQQNSSSFFSLPAGWSPQAVGDVNGDGRADIVWTNASANLAAIWFMNGSTVSSTAYYGVPSSWSVAAIGDFNGDGKADILWRNVNGQITAWLMNGSTIQSVVNYSNVDSSWTVLGTGDFFGDGKSEVVWVHQPDGTIYLWRNVDQSTPQLISRGVPGGTWQVVAIGDFDGDGMADLFLRDASGANAIWKAGLSSSAVFPPGVSTSWSVMTAKQLYGDGRSDVVWRRNDGLLAQWRFDSSLTPTATFLTTVPMNWSKVGN